MHRREPTPATSRFDGWRARLAAAPVVAIIRHDRPVPDVTFDALVAGGIRFVEVTVGTPGWAETVREWSARAPEGVDVGVGTVTDAVRADAALAADARFLVAPNLDPDVVALAGATPVLCGALTPTEIVAAWQAGAAAVKVFPVGAVGGARYIADVTAPLPEIPLVAVGGVGTANAADHLDAGCLAVAVGSALFAGGVLDDADGGAGRIEARARALLDVLGTR